MQQGPDHVIACPHCGTKLKIFTLFQQNTTGAVYWTDGKMEAPMMPKPPPITRCEKCKAFFWIVDAELVTEAEPSACALAAEQFEADSGIPRIKHLNREELLEAVELEEWEDDDREFMLRLLAWWAANDPARKGETYKFSERDIDNLNRLSDILDPDLPEHRIIKAEIFRELGKFDDALKLLDAGFDGGVDYITGTIRDLCLKRDSVVKSVSVER